MPLIISSPARRVALPLTQSLPTNGMPSHSHHLKSVVDASSYSYQNFVEAESLMDSSSSADLFLEDRLQSAPPPLLQMNEREGSTAIISFSLLCLLCALQLDESIMRGIEYLIAPFQRRLSRAFNFYKSSSDAPQIPSEQKSLAPARVPAQNTKPAAEEIDLWDFINLDTPIHIEIWKNAIEFKSEVGLHYPLDGITSLIELYNWHLVRLRQKKSIKGAAITLEIWLKEGLIYSSAADDNYKNHCMAAALLIKAHEIISKESTQLPNFSRVDTNRFIVTYIEYVDGLNQQQDHNPDN